MSRQADQPAAQALPEGQTLDLFASVYGPGSAVTWPDAIWTSSTPSVATVAAVSGAPNTGRVTGVAVGVAVITATVANTEQQFTVDVVEETPQAVIVAPID